MQNTKPHAALLSSPGLGHFIPVIELGKRLVTNHGFSVTVFVVTTDNSLSKSQLLKQSPCPDLLNIVLLPPVDVSGLITPATGILSQLAIMMREALPKLRSAILAMKFCPTVLIVDLFGIEAMVIAEEFNMLKYAFITSTAWFLALTLHMPTIDKVIEDNHVKNQQALLIPGCKSLEFGDTFEPILDRNDQMYTEYKRMGVDLQKFDGILVNTWQDLEGTTLVALEDGKKSREGGSGNSYLPRWATG
ncbi:GLYCOSYLTRANSFERASE [Salix viminalis]|uniref:GLYCOSYLTRANSFERASE n=1 Tax=Salix viminalis TaxID=40686 RepID=A0A9Q0NZD6_SALVM|nr:GLYCOSYLTRANSFERASE [Salix viminalis]